MKKIILLTAFAAITIASSHSAIADSHQSGNTHKQYKECAAIRMKEIALKHLKGDNPNHYTQVPASWTVVSGTGGEGHPKLLICR